MLQTNELVESLETVWWHETQTGMIFCMPRAPQPPSLRVEADMRARIEAGEWKRDEALPSVAVLAEHYGVARQTVARVFRRLEADGLVRVVPSWGTFRV